MEEQQPVAENQQDGGDGGRDGGRGGGFGGRRGRGRGGFRGRGRRGRRGRGRRGRGRGNREDDWQPVTKLGRLVKAGEKIKDISDIYRFSLCIKEYQIIDKLIPPAQRGGRQMQQQEDAPTGPRLQEEVMKIMPVQKQTTAGQRTRFKAFVCVGDSNGHVGLGWKTASEVTEAIRGAVISAKMSLIPIRRGFWGNKIGKPHTICSKLTGKCGSVRMRLIPAPRGTGLVAANAPRKLLQFAGLEDCYSSSTGHTRTKGNFLKATFYALQKSYSFLSPDLWHATCAVEHPYEELDQKDFEEERMKTMGDDRVM